MVSTARSGDTLGSSSLTRSPLEQLRHLLVSLLRWWPYGPHERIPSLLISGPASNGKSHLVCSVADAANAHRESTAEENSPAPETGGNETTFYGEAAKVTAAASQTSALTQARGHPLVLTVIPHLSKALAVQNAHDGSTGLRRLLRREIRDACVTPRRHRSLGLGELNGDSAPWPQTGICILLVLDHMECYLQKDDTHVPGGSSGSTTATSHADPVVRQNGSVGESSRESGSAQDINTVYPAFLADLYTVLRNSPPLFSEEECAALRLVRLVCVSLFTGGMEEVLPVVRHRYVDYAVALPTPTEAARRAFFLKYATAPTDTQAPLLLPLSLVDALTLRTGGISYGGLQEVLAHALDYCAASPHRLSGAIEENKDVVSAMAQSIVHAYQTSGSVTASEYRRSAGFVDVQVTRWEHIAGMTHVKEALRRLVTDPIRHRTTYQQFSVRPSTGVLLHGPPGTGKTMLAKAMATELNASFVYMDIPKLVQAEVGESERRLQEYFDIARDRSPSLVFMDEIQAAFGLRYATVTDAHPHQATASVPHGGACTSASSTAHDARLVSHLLRLLDAAQQDDEHFVVFVGATNVLHMLDPLLLRAGRLDTLLEVPLPDAAARESLVRRVVYGEWAHWFCDQECGTSPAATNAINTAVPAPMKAERLEHLRSALVEALVDRSEGLSGAEARNLASVFGLQVARMVSRRLGVARYVTGDEAISHRADSHDLQQEQHNRQLRLRGAITDFLSESGGTSEGLSRDALALINAAQKKAAV